MSKTKVVLCSYQSNVATFLITACECDPEGSRNGQCNKRDGQCSCYNGITNRTCDTCIQEGFWGPLNRSCRSCECVPENTLECVRVRLNGSDVYISSSTFLTSTWVMLYCLPLIVVGVSTEHSKWVMGTQYISSTNGMTDWGHWDA